MTKIQTWLLALSTLLPLISSAGVLVKNVNGEIIYNITATVGEGELIEAVRVVISEPGGNVVTGPTPAFTPAASVSVSGSYKPTKSGSYFVVAYAITSSGVEAPSGTGQVQVNNNPPELTLSAANASITANMGESITINIDAIDPDSNLREVRLYRQSPPLQLRKAKSDNDPNIKSDPDEGPPYVEINQFESLDSQAVSSAVAAAIPTNRSGVYNYRLVATDAEGMESELIIPVTAINPTRKMAVKVKTVVKPEYEGWFTDSEVVERTVDVRKYREEYRID